MTTLTRALVLAVGLLAVNLAGVAAASDVPDVTGPWKVGHTAFTAVDTSRDDRPLPLHIWYPVDTPDWIGGPTFYTLLGPIGLTSALAIDDVDVSSAGPRPLIVFSHGFGGISLQSVRLMEHLASHGFVVVAPEHTGNTQFDFSSPDPEADRFPDIAFVIDEMDIHNTTVGDAFFGRVDAHNVGVAGHSFGGMTAQFMAAGHDPFPPDVRVKAIMPIAASSDNLTDDELRSITIPTLLMVGTLDGLQADTIRSFDLIGSTPFLYRVDVVGANHTHFANVCDIGNALIDLGFPIEVWEVLGAGALIPIYESTCVPPAFSIEEAIRIQNLYAVALFRRHLLGETFYDSFLTEAYALASEPDVVFFGCGTRQVSPSGSDVGNNCLSPGSPCLTIQHAVEQVCTGDTVLVAPGRYAEAPVIHKSLRLAASHPASEANVGNDALQAIIDGTGAIYAVTVLAGVSDVTIDGFEITNPSHAGVNTDAAGILVQTDDAGGATVTVHILNNVIHDTADSTRPAASFGELGISAFNIGNGSTITDNVIFGIGDDDGAAQRAQAILVKSSNGSASGLTVSGNTVHDIQDVAIRLNGVGGCSVTGNTIDTVGTGGLAFLTGIGIEHTGTGSITGNTVSNITGGAGAGIIAGGPLTVSGNTVTNVTTVGNPLFPGAGIAVGVSGVSVTSNLVSGNGIGILVSDGSGGTLSSVTVKRNCISGNTTGLVNDSQTGLDAANNYWGAADGPSGTGLGSGDAIVDNAGVTIFSPFATSPNCAPVCGVADADADGLGDICDEDDVAGLSLRLMRLVARVSGRHRVGVKGELDATPTPTFHEDVDADGVTLIVETAAGEQVASLSFSGTECASVGPSGGSMKCKNPTTRSVVVFRRRSAPSFFRLAIRGRNLSFTQPTVPEGPMVLRVQTPTDLLDRRDDINGCAEKRGGEILLCREAF